MLFQDRTDAGQQLAERLTAYRTEDPIVLAMPRGGVAVGYEVARALGAPLDVLVARKLNAPSHPELGIGAIAPGGVRVLDEPAVRAFGVSEAQLDQITAEETAELERRTRCYRGERPLPDLRLRTVILVDDGLATGVTAQAALAAIRQCQPRKVILAVPVCAPRTAAALRPTVDDLVSVATPLNLFSVGYWYHEFEQLSDEEVLALLDRARANEDAAPRPGAGAGGSPVGLPRPSLPVSERPLPVQAGAVALEGDLSLPEGARAVVLFAHGSGSGRHSPRNRFVAEALHAHRLATLLLDLLTPEEAAADAESREHRFDIALLAGRLTAAIDALSREPSTQSLLVGLYGASTGAAAALVAAAERPDRVGAIVSRGGRPDLAGSALERVRAPTLLLVGGSDLPVLRLNRDAFQPLPDGKKLVVIPGAGHLFEEPGALEEVARLTAGWFDQHLART